MSVAIKVENVSKKYLIQTVKPSDTFRDKLAEVGRPRSHREEFWALKDVSFEVKQGEVLGVIGKNGSGKSTLLKILSRITEPTNGKITLKGRVASLLEVGTGFSPELSGRENIFLNGSILGMTRKEILKKFDEIVDFAGVEQFIDTPVKRYSSGMYVRLAFAVAAHLDTDILFVDEVLAVGDIEFQSKSLKKMRNLAHNGQSVVFVSHDLEAIRNLCSKTVLLNDGSIQKNGNTLEVVEEYFKAGSKINNFEEKDESRAVKHISINSVCVKGSGGKPHSNTTISQKFSICIRYTVTKMVANSTLTIIVYRNGIKLLVISESDLRHQLLNYNPGNFETCVKIPPYLLNVGAYRIDIFFHTPFVRTIDSVLGLPLIIHDDKQNPRSRFFRGKSEGYIGSILPFKTVAI